MKSNNQRPIQIRGSRRSGCGAPGLIVRREHRDGYRSGGTAEAHSGQNSQSHCGRCDDGDVAVTMCFDIDTTLTSTIANGLVPGRSLAGTKGIEVSPARRNNRGWPEVIVAGRIEPEGVIAAWAVARSGGPIVALNNHARGLSVWGEAAQPGSPMDQTRDRLWGYPETRDVIRCAERDQDPD